MSDKKIWFITGASRGFGRIWTEAALKRGDSVAAGARDPHELANLTSIYGDAVVPLRFDVTVPAEVKAAIETAYTHFGRIDVVVNNAGYAYMGTVEEMSTDELGSIFETNFFGAVHVIKAALPILKAQKSGHILNVSSVAGVLSFPTAGAYTSTKFALEALSESLAGEVADFGIKVTLIEPGSYSITFRSSTKVALGLPEYDPVREKIRSAFRAEDAGDPTATPEALFAAVYSPAPPLRLILGSRTLPMIKTAYEQRMALWEQWVAVSDGAQGHI